LSGAANWLTNSVATVFNNSDSVTFDNSATNLTVTLAGTLQPALVTFNASKNYAFNGAGSIAGTNALVKSGTGTLTINPTNTYSGGTILSNGIVTPGSAIANMVALGSGPVTFDGGTLEFNGWTGSTTPDYGGNTNPLVVPANQSGTIHVPQRFLTPGLKGALSGAGTLNLQVKYVRGDISGDFSAFAGKLNVTYSSGGSTIDDFRVANPSGFPNAKLNVGTNVQMYSRALANSIIPIGEFSAALGAIVGADGAGGAGGKNLVAWRVGGLNTDTTNGASFQGIVALIKEGTGAWTLTGTSTHTGSTVVSNGTVTLNGSFNGSPITVYGGVLGGTGVISGAPVTVNLNGGFAPGNVLGTMTISNNLTFAPGSTAYMRVQHSPFSNTFAKVVGTLTESGALIVANANGSAFAAGDRFKLFDATNYSGSFAGFAFPALTGNLAWSPALLNVDGSLWVVSTVPPAITHAAVTPNTLVLSGTGGTPNWNYYVLMATNITLPTSQWARVATNSYDGVGNFTFTNPINLTLPAALFRVQSQ
jgi:autotransporter-associated beta strand protein